MVLRVERNLAWQALRVAQGSPSAGHDAHLHDGISVGQVPPSHSMASLVPRHRAPLALHLRSRLLLQPAEDAVHRRVEVLHAHCRVTLACGDEGRLVAHICNLGAAHAGRQRGEAVGVVSRCALATVERERCKVHAEDLLAPLNVRLVHRNLAIEAPRPQEGAVEHVGAVGAREDDDARCGAEAVHLDEELVERVLALVVAPAGHVAAAARAAHGVNLVDEDEAGSHLARLGEHIAHARGPHAHKHLDEVGARDGEEGRFRLARHRLGQQRLAAPRWSHEQSALGDARAQARVIGRVLEEVDELHHLSLGFLEAGHVLERGVHLGGPLGLALGHLEDLARAPGPHAAPGGIAVHEHHETEHERGGHPAQELRSQRGGAHVAHGHEGGGLEAEVALRGVQALLELVHRPDGELEGQTALVTRRRSGRGARLCLAPREKGRLCLEALPLARRARGYAGTAVLRCVGGAKGRRRACGVLAQVDPHCLAIHNHQAAHAARGEHLRQELLKGDLAPGATALAPHERGPVEGGGEERCASRHRQQLHPRGHTPIALPRALAAAIPLALAALAAALARAARWGRRGTTPTRSTARRGGGGGGGGDALAWREEGLEAPWHGLGLRLLAGRGGGGGGDRRRQVVLPRGQLVWRVHPQPYRALHRWCHALQLPLLQGLVAKVLPAPPRLAPQGGLAPA
mmetsp:Transcript_24340/g.66060  ORF Transcript_24340/g.66060 Transcript_24340/m.66060 type:complete len:688 (-) Transcript_24340:757-2820(-)